MSSAKMRRQINETKFADTLGSCRSRLTDVTPRWPVGRVKDGAPISIHSLPLNLVITISSGKHFSCFRR